MPGGSCFKNLAVALRQATADDDAFLRDLFAAIRGPDFAMAGLPEVIVADLLRQQYRAQTASYAAAFPQATSLVILHEGADVGRVLFAGRPKGEDWALHIVDIAILPARQGQGLGTEVIEALADAARADRAVALTLSVLSTNARALRLYERLGFVEAEAGVHTAMVKCL